MGYTEQIFQGVKTRDPKINIKGNSVSLCPSYLNYSFLSILGIFTFFLIIYFLYGHPEDFWIDKLNFYLILVIIFFPILLVLELKYYNTVIINLDERIISVTPNFLLRPIKKKRIFSFNEIRRIEPQEITTLLGTRINNRAFAIGLILKNSDELKILSIDNPNIAKEISKRLSSIVSSYKS